MLDVHDEYRYLRAVVDEFRDDAARYTGFELRKKLWHACVVVCEVTGDYQDWQLTLADIASKAGISAKEVISTVKSARRKAGVA